MLDADGIPALPWSSTLLSILGQNMFKRFSQASVIESIESLSVPLANFPTLGAEHQYLQHIAL